tara:strand:+ start:329 stop:805 length:477 start_codon:yes stop_codon:yes gene_type:complete
MAISLNKNIFYFVYLSFCACLLSCNNRNADPSLTKKSHQDLYEPSELASTMRDMALDMEGLKLKVNTGSLTIEVIDKLISSHSTMSSDEPTEIKEIQPSFQLFSNIYIEQLEELKKNILKQGEISEQILLFNSALTTCVSCHREHCPGPISRIEKIKI